MMDLVSLHTLSSLLGAITQMVAIISVVFCAVSLFSIKPGASLRFVFLSLIYLFSSAIILSAIAYFLMKVSGQFMGLGGINALMGACVLHLFFAFIVIVLYIRHIRS